ncbi:MAG: signal peptidase I [Clostridia bacterium]|nr:signal peptidase I [Clostridia bacterium]
MKKNIKYIINIFIIGLVVFLVNKFLIQICFVQGDSMYPNLKNGEMLFIKKFDLKYNYNDIVIIKKKDKTIIKRIVGLPKDSIKIDNYLYINGEKRDDIYIENPGDIKNEILLNENEFFVLGDNIQHSIDSRFNEIGIISKNEIIGKIINK